MKTGNCAEHLVMHFNKSHVQSTANNYAQSKGIYHMLHYILSLAMVPHTEAKFTNGYNQGLTQYNIFDILRLQWDYGCE